MLSTRLLYNKSNVKYSRQTDLRRKKNCHLYCHLFKFNNCKRLHTTTATMVCILTKNQLMISLPTKTLHETMASFKFYDSEHIAQVLLKLSHQKDLIFNFQRHTAWKVSKYEVFSVHIFPHSDWVPKNLHISPYSVRMRENTEQKKLRIWTLFTQWQPQWKALNQWLIISNWHNLLHS